MNKTASFWDTKSQTESLARCKQPSEVETLTSVCLVFGGQQDGDIESSQPVSGSA